MKKIPLLINADIQNNTEDFARTFLVSFRRGDGTPRFARFDFNPEENLSYFCEKLRTAADKIEEDAELSHTDNT